MKIVSIIIPHHNGKDLLHNCINSIYNNISIENFEIIVVDNASTDNSVQNIQTLFPDVVHHQAAGHAAAALLMNRSGVRSV